MKKIFILFLICTTFLSLGFSQSSPQKEMEESIKELEGEFNQMFKEFEEIMKSPSTLLDQFQIEKLNDEGWMLIEGDSIKINTMFDFLTENMEKLPPMFRPSDEHIENLKGTSKMLPDLLLKSKEMLEQEDWDKLLNEMFRNLNPQMLPPSRKPPVKKTEPGTIRI